MVNSVCFLLCLWVVLFFLYIFFSFPCTIIYHLAWFPCTLVTIVCLLRICFIVDDIFNILIQGVDSGRTYSPVGEEEEYIKGKSKKNPNVRVDRSKRYEFFILNFGLLIFISRYWFLKVQLAAVTFFSFSKFFFNIFIWKEHLFFQKCWEIPWILEHLWTSCHQKAWLGVWCGSLCMHCCPINLMMLFFSPYL